MDKLRDDLINNYSDINIFDFSFYNVDILNRCENEGSVLITVDYWKNVHLFMKTIPVDWNYTISYGFLHSANPSPQVKAFLKVFTNILSIKRAVKK